MTAKIEAHRLSTGELATFAWPGGYPLFYVTDHGDVLCAKCAMAAEDDDGFDLPTDVDVHWEGEPLECSGCRKEIESAYGVPE